MTLQTFQEAYTETMVKLIKVMSEREAIRISQILQKGSHYEINKAEQDIIHLSKSRMIVNTFESLPTDK